MSKTSFADVYDQYLNDVPGCTYPVAANALRIAAQVFCERTRAWTLDLDPIITRANAQDYEIDLPGDIDIVKVISATIDGQDLPIVPASRAGGAGRCLVVRGPFDVTLHPAPAKGQRIVIHAAVAPSNTAASIEKQIFRKYLRIIAHGAKAELFSMKNQPFSNALAAIDERQQFDAGINQTIGGLSRQSGPPRVVASFM